MSAQVFKYVQRKATSLDPSRFQSTAAGFVTQMRSSDTVTFLVAKLDGIVHQLLVTDVRGGGDQVALALSNTYNAHMEEAELPDLSDVTEQMVRVKVSAGRHGRDNQSSADLLVLASSLLETMSDDTWVAVSVRSPSKAESKAHALWLAHRLGVPSPVHHSTRKSAMVVSVTAGGRDQHLVESIAAFFMGALPGFDLQTESVALSAKSKLRKGLPVAAAAVGANVGLPFVPEEVANALPETLGTLLWGVAGVSAAAGAFGMTRFAPNARQSGLASLRSGFRPPLKRGGAPRAPRKETMKSIRRKDAEGNVIVDQVRVPEFDGDYPLHAESFMMCPSLFSIMLSPHSMATTGESAEKERSLPPALAERRGPKVGVHASGAAVYFDAGSMQHGVSIFGTPGSGKSVMSRLLFGWNCLEKRSPSGMPGAPGARNTLIAFENKGRGGADTYLRWGEATGIAVKLLDLMNPRTPSLDFFPRSKHPGVNAQSFMNAMTEAYGAESIGAQAGPVLLHTFTASQAVDAAVVTAHNEMPGALEMPTRMSPVYYAWRLLGGRNSGDAKMLFEAIKQCNEDSDRQNPWYKIAAETLGYLFEQTDSQRRTLTGSSKNKLDELVQLEPWWTPGRPKLSWTDILNNHDSVVLNMGPSADSVSFVNDRVMPRVSSMVMTTLKEAITQTCDDWESQARWVTLFADELSMIAGSSGSVIEWVRSKGRSFGVRPVFATQYPEQLSAQVRDSLMDYSTFVSFRQGNRNTAATIAHQITTSTTQWSDEDLTLMPNYHLVVRSQAGGKPQDATLLKCDYFEDRMEEFAEHQGYMPTATCRSRPVELVTAPPSLLGARKHERLEELDEQL